MDDEARKDSTPAEAAAPRYQSLSDYLRMLRRQRLLIVGLTVLVGASALVLSLGQERTYEATTAASFRDPLQDLNLLGTATLPEQAPTTRSQIAADLMTSPRVVQRAREELGTEFSVDQLTEMLSTFVDLNTALIALTAESDDPEFAANLANAVMQGAARIETRSQRRRLNDAIRSLERTRRETLRAARRGEAGEFDVTGANTALIRLQNLRDVAQLVSITQRARVPDDPVSPKPVRNTGLGLLVGLVLGLIAGFLRDSLDRRLRTAHDAHEELGLPVLARVAESAFGYPGLAKQNGVTMRDADFEPFRVLRTNLAYLTAERSPRLVLVTSGLPEEGKSTVSMALASAAALAGQRVLMIECDVRRPSFARRLGVRPEPGLADYLRGRVSPQDVIQTVDLYEPWSTNGSPDSTPERVAGGLVCITAGSQATDTIELLDSDRFRDMLTKVSQAYDLVVLDGSPLLAVVDPLRIAPLVDGVLICVRMLQTTREEAKAVRSALENLPERPTGAVVTGLSRSGPDAYEYYSGY